VVRERRKRLWWQSNVVAPGVRRSLSQMSRYIARGRHVRWPRWGPRSTPKQGHGFESRGTERVLWIVGSTDRHLIQALSPRHQRAVPADTGADADRPPRASSWPSRLAISLFSTAEAPRRFDRLKLGQIEFDNRPQGFGEPHILDGLGTRQGTYQELLEGRWQKSPKPD
jgi:hypothetical protein